MEYLLFFAHRIPYPPNKGVDFDFFDPDEKYLNPYEDARQVLVFTGQMDYWANVDTVQWFAEKCFR